MLLRSTRCDRSRAAMADTSAAALMADGRK
jgi:hypothetical protein